eukprot:EG_transcript_14504
MEDGFPPGLLPPPPTLLPIGPPVPQALGLPSLFETADWLSPGSPIAQVEDGRRKRKCQHNEVEKRRRSRINSNLQALQALFPLRRGTSLTKLDTVEYTTQYIRDLQQTLLQKTEERKQLEEDCKRLREEMAQLQVGRGQPPARSAASAQSPSPSSAASDAPSSAAASSAALLFGAAPAVPCKLEPAAVPVADGPPVNLLALATAGPPGPFVSPADAAGGAPPAPPGR